MSMHWYVLSYRYHHRINQNLALFTFTRLLDDLNRFFWIFIISQSSFKDDVKASKEESNRLEKKNTQLQDEVKLLIRESVRWIY